MHDVSREESDLFQQDLCAKEKSEREHRTFNSMKFGGNKDFAYETNLEG